MAGRIECPECHRKVRNLKLHFRKGHPDLAMPLPESPPAVETKREYVESPAYAEKKAKEVPQEQPQQEQQADPLEKLKVLGIEPQQVMQVLTPLVEASVVKTLEVMRLREVINKKMGEVETRLSGQIQQTLEPLQQAVNHPQSSGGEDNQSPDTQLRNQALSLIMQGVSQKLLNPNPAGNLEQITKTLELAGNVANVVMKPYTDGQAAARKEMNETIRLITGITRLSPEQQAVIASTLAGSSPD